MTSRIAVVDDEPRMVEIIAMVLRRAGHEVRTFADPEALLGSLEREPIDLLLTDLRMPGMDGVEVMRRARRALPGLPVILLTAHATVETAIAAMKEGAFDYVQKPFDNDELKALVLRALDHSLLARENCYLRAAAQAAMPAIVAESAAMKQALAIVRRVAPSRATVLVTGESGTGKEVIARAIHACSDRGSSLRDGRPTPAAVRRCRDAVTPRSDPWDRAEGPFVALNVKALSESVLESELFGHEKGAFTGAERQKPGVFERASGGTLFLDEIGEISADFQAKLLRVLQEREVLPVGATSTRPVDVRVVAATNRDLARDVEEGRFREDLYFRLAVIPIRLAPLRARREDILPLARVFLAKMERETGRRLDGWTPEVESYLLTHAWPGNVRELANVIERGAVLASGPRIELCDVSMDEAPSDPSTGAVSLAELLDRATAEHVRRVLEEVSGKRMEAAKKLGIDRTTLYRLMRKYDLGE